eukprot:GFUD01036788.1.p1 GENE.GFUD01036788.1~~GFUD01036788.1.p1  ORF type:complete len:363 (-),score=88.20 GFUD01036788.1:37-1125(-)
MSSWFWNPDIWLPPNVTWDSFDESDPEIAKEAFVSPGTFARFSDLWYPIPLAILVMIARWVVERGIFKKVGIWMGMKDYKRTFPAHNQVLESVFRSVTDPSLREVDHLSAESGLSIRQVERWFRQRRQAELPNTLQKFCETGWRFVFYLGILTYGFSCLWYKSWFWNIHNCWADYPNHKVDRDIWLYYMLELSFYWSLSITQFFDVKRKDFWEMFIHHNTTIALMMFSWSTHFTRVGTLVLIIHDCADHLLELAKIFRYINYRKCCDVVFGIFALVWVVTRCGVFPSCILYSTLHDAGRDIEMFPAYYIFNTLLFILQLLNLVWTYFIFKIVHKALTKGEVKDSRSDSEGTSEDEDENKKEK